MGTNVCTLQNCFQYIKGTKKKANHNITFDFGLQGCIVSNTSKVLKRKQITTTLARIAFTHYCFQYIKGTKKKANHNACFFIYGCSPIVSNTSKVLKRKQITTRICGESEADALFPIHQRY